MAIARAQLMKELLPGLNALFGMEYARYPEEWRSCFDVENSDRSFEEETKLSGFGAAPTKDEGAARRPLRGAARRCSSRRLLQKGQEIETGGSATAS